MPDYSGFLRIGKLVSVLVSVADHSAPKSLLHTQLELEAEVGIGLNYRFRYSYFRINPNEFKGNSPKLASIFHYSLTLLLTVSLTVDLHTLRGNSGCYGSMVTLEGFLGPFRPVKSAGLKFFAVEIEGSCHVLPGGKHIPASEQIQVP